MTPIAAELHAHFAAGGSVEAGIRLVENREREWRALVAQKGGPSSRGARLSANWWPTDAQISYALDRGLSQPRVMLEAEKFKNFWIAKAGAGATKRDWEATWRNWILNALERSNGFTNGSAGAAGFAGRAAIGSDPVMAGMGRLASRLDQRRAAAIDEGWKVSGDSNPPGPANVEGE